MLLNLLLRKRRLKDLRKMPPTSLFGWIAKLEKQLALHCWFTGVSEWESESEWEWVSVREWVKWSEVKWSEVTWKVKWSEKWSEVKWSEVSEWAHFWSSLKLFEALPVSLLRNVMRDESFERACISSEIFLESWSFAFAFQCRLLQLSEVPWSSLIWGL